MKSDDETAKPASTEEETRVEDEDGTSMENESDTDSGRAWSVDTEEDEGVVKPPRINYLNMQDPEPEWDVDSFDGYECYDSDDRKSFSDDEEYEEFRQFKIPAWKNKGTTVECVSIVRGNLKVGGGTFIAREPGASLCMYHYGSGHSSPPETRTRDLSNRSLRCYQLSYLVRVKIDRFVRSLYTQRNNMYTHVTTMKSDDETAKLASTEEETRVEDEDDTIMEEESDSDNEGLWSVDEEEDDVERSPTINYSNMIEPEPEWDKDSYDGYECVFDPDGREGFPNDEAYEDFREYKIQAWKNRGFLEDPFRSVYPILDLEDLWSDRVNATRRQYLTNIASLGVGKLNEEKGSSVEVVSIARSNLKPGGGYKLYITFMAREVCLMKMSSDDVTPNRCSTEEESDSSVSKKLKVEDEDDRNMEDESDTDSGQALSVETEEDEGVVRPPRNNFFNMQDPEPEWDKDSFDGYECYDPEDRESFSNDEEYEEFREFKFQAWKNKGFYEEGPFRYIFPLTDLEQRFRNMTTREYLADIASLCVKKLNEEKDERVCNLLRSVEFVSIVRGNLKAGDGWKLYITFTAREYLDGPLVEYQAKAMDLAGGETPPFPIICRPAPSIDADGLALTHVTNQNHEGTSGLFHSTATMKGDDVSVKRASTEVESDASVSKKPKIEDEDDTSMEEESDSDNEGLWSVDAEDDDDGVRSPTINYSNLQDPEPEWDKDSYDGYELEFDPDGREGFSSDKAYAEFRDYKTKAFENRGFLEDPFRSIYPIRDLDDLWTTTTKRQYLTDIASLCVKKLNDEKGMSVEVVSIVRGNLKPGGGWKLYITFMAREYPDGPIVEYQAKAVDYAGHKIPPFPILCRPASSIS
ncbi:unnamed protein product [Brassica oleracea var. botrytis]